MEGGINNIQVERFLHAWEKVADALARIATSLEPKKSVMNPLRGMEIKERPMEWGD